MSDYIKNFYDLIAWKKAHEFILSIYKTTKNFPKDELFGITAQLRRATVSIAANIAEGFERHYFKDKERFYFHARGSLAEVQNYLFIILDLKFIDKSKFDDFFNQTIEIRKLLNGLIRSTDKQFIK